MRIGVDTGGTFTDFVWLDAEGNLTIHKESSTPTAPAVAVLEGMNVLRVPTDCAVIHGSTVATNALLQRRGARTALIATAGFADVLEIARQNRPDLYALVPQKPAPLVPAAWRFEVTERVTAAGVIQVPLAVESIRSIADKIVEAGIESVAVSLLFSFLQPHHEQQIAAALKSDARLAASATGPEPARELFVSLSSEILPEYREFERTAATAINAYVAPLMSRYLQDLEAGLQGRPLAVMQSNGGVIDAATASRLAVRTVLSGPAGGVVGATYVAGLAAEREDDRLADLISFDMGGTSTDVALCPGELPRTSTGEIAGLPLRLPIIDIHTVGAGGGSLAYADAAGALHVGPQSAGAEPGPACYDPERPGLAQADLVRLLRSRATVTDANLVLGRLDAAHFLGGSVPLNLAAAKAALSSLASLIGAPTLLSAAADIVAVANATMERAIRRVSVERGHDPRRFTLVAFGGAGPLHACELARDLQIPRVLIPAVPGVLSALGMLAAAPTQDYSRTLMFTADLGQVLSSDSLDPLFEPLREKAMRAVTDQGHDPAELLLFRSLDMRYTGQSHELEIALPAFEPDVTALFQKTHLSRYGYVQEGAAVEIVTIRLKVVARVARPQFAAQAAAGPDASAALVGEKAVWFGGQSPTNTRLYSRSKLRTGNRLSGPAIIFQYDTTTVIPPGWQARVDPFANLLLSQSR